MLKAEILTHGGIMVNYQCNASCRHCLYSCSPQRHSGYVSEESADEICRLLRKGGCRSVHIGGGEPFLDFNSLVMMIKKLNNAGITLDYIETNAFWATEDSAAEKINRLLAEGADTFCISVDPFHAEYIPYGAALTLAQLCEKSKMNYFLWKQEFLPALLRLDRDKIHLRENLETSLSSKYIYNTARTYGISLGGRAVNIEKEYSEFFPAENFSSDDSPCRNLLSTGHFHVDKDVCFIPPRCTGIRIPLAEIVNGIPEGKYPAFEALYNGGLYALLALARQNGFTPDGTGYTSKCNFCFYIRRFLAEKDFAELDLNHYEEALKHY